MPGTWKLRGKHIALKISVGKNFSLAKNELLHKSKAAKKRNSVFRLGNSALNSSLESAVAATELLRGRDSFVAGLPWFQQYWSRDLFWSLPAIVSLGQFEEAKRSLELFAANAKKGQIPNFLFRGSRAFNSIDATPLFLIALEKYALQSGDRGFIKKMSKPALRALEFLESRRDEKDGFVLHDLDSSETWMDTLRRGEKAVEVQALFIRALESASSFFRLLDRPPKRFAEKAEWAEFEASELLQKFNSAFLEKGFYADRISGGKPDRSRRINALVPLFLGFPEKGGMVEAFESPEFLTPRGIVPLSRNDPRFNPESYHEGAVWSLGNAWLCGAQFLCGKTESAWKTFGLIASDAGRDSLGCIGET